MTDLSTAIRQFVDERLRELLVDFPPQARAPQRVACSITETAQLLEVPTHQIYRLVKAGELPAFQVGTHIRVAATAIDQFAVTRTTAGAAS